MPNQTSTENNFTKGLLTEFTGLNFPENAATDTENCVYTLVGDVTRRLGINQELNGTTTAITIPGNAVSSYVWNNPGGDGNSKLLVKQVGSTLYFYNIAASTANSPISTKKLAGTATLSAISGQTVDITKECTYADGIGYLFVYHTNCDPIYVTYNPNTFAITANTITVQIRDFLGVRDNIPVNSRPTALTTDHNYNLQNQGWTTANPWQGSDTTLSYQSPLSVGVHVFTIAGGLTITNGTLVSIVGFSATGSEGPLYYAAATVTGYAGTSLTVNCTSTSPVYTRNVAQTVITPISTGYISTWFADEGNYPSNADVWWYFKDTTGVFNPTATQPNVNLTTGQAPQGHFILNAFDMNRNLVSGLTSITEVSTVKRPTNGCWFQGRVWYTGASDGFAITGDANYYTWSENIYFSTIVTNPSDFGLCYQTNDPTSETLNAELPTDGGVITIVGAGTIHKLFPIANGLLVFANNGVWFITGSQGIGFSANDYTITKISSVRVLSNHSFVDVLGLPYFWNEEGIYAIEAKQGGQLAVEPLTVGTILTFYNEIPLSSKKYARGDYDPINYIIQWVFKGTQETGVTDRYQYDKTLNFNTYNKAFYPYEIMAGGSSQTIHGINYISYPYISTATPLPGFKFGYNTPTTISFAEEYDTSYKDWGSTNYTSYFVTGYKLHGGAIYKFQIPYINLYNRLGQAVAYKIQSVWDAANTGNSGRWSVAQIVNIFNPNYDMQVKRHRLRGRGYALQIKVSSVDGMPFDIMGWSIYENVNAGV